MRDWSFELDGVGWEFIVFHESIVMRDDDPFYGHFVFPVFDGRRLLLDMSYDIRWVLLTICVTSTWGNS